MTIKAKLLYAAAASDLVAGAGVWAKTGVAKSRKDAPIAAATREEIVMRSPSVGMGGHGCAIMLNLG